MAITQAQIIEAMVATTLEEKKQWVQRLQRKYDRDRAKSNNNKQQQATNDASLSASLSPNRIPSFLVNSSEKDDFSSLDNKNTTSKLYEGSPDEQKSSSLGFVGNVSQSNSNNQTQKSTISS